ncbi:MAG: hypothetical protein BroJett042_02310 [Bacteroidota bacterium]|nr:MAG: hypothetical protein BroJett042_02310 [Bacteroidota bacterium]
MEDWERQKFEEHWKSAFEDAEQPPSDRVWWSIENALTQAEGGAMKRKLIFYKRLAAASVVLALVLAGSTTYVLNESHPERAVTKTEKTEVQPGSKTLTNNQGVEAGNTVNAPNTATGNKPDSKNSKPDLPVNEIQDQSSGYLSNKQVSENTLLPADGVVHHLQRFGIAVSDPLAQHYNTNLHTKGTLREVTIVRILPARPASMMADTRSRKDVKENLWAAVNASAGSYTSYTQSDRSQSFLMSSQPGSFSNLVPVSSSANPRGNAYSVGVNMGTRLARRWVLQGGISYLNQSQGYISNFAAVGVNNSTMAMVSDYTAARESLTLSPTTTYTINSVSELVSVPLQAGYLLINRKFGLQLNSGIATNMFIRNTLTDKSGQLNSFSESAGSDSPYNSFSWSALGGTELSYKIGRQYRVSVAPGFRYGLTPLLKTGSENTNPFMWDLGFRFRYIMK